MTQGHFMSSAHTRAYAYGPMTGVDITPAIISLRAMRKVLPQGWYRWDWAPPLISNEKKTDTTLLSQAKSRKLIWIIVIFKRTLDMAQVQKYGAPNEDLTHYYVIT